MCSAVTNASGSVFLMLQMMGYVLESSHSVHFSSRQVGIATAKQSMAKDTHSLGGGHRASDPLLKVTLTESRIHGKTMNQFITNQIKYCS